MLIFMIIVFNQLGSKRGNSKSKPFRRNGQRRTPKDYSNMDAKEKENTIRLVLSQM